jgi:hypothetical protein
VRSIDISKALIDNFERGTRDMLVRLNEDVNDLRVTFKEMTQVIDQMAKVIALISQASDGMKDAVDDIRKQNSPPRDPN